MHLKSGAQLTTDSGYQGLAKLHVNSVLPKKSSKNHPLLKQDRKQNRDISRKLIVGTRKRTINIREGQNYARDLSR